MKLLLLDLTSQFLFSHFTFCFQGSALWSLRMRCRLTLTFSANITFELSPVLKPLNVCNRQVLVQ